MLFQPRIVAFILALLIATITAAFSNLVDSTPPATVALTFLVAITSSFLLIYFSFEYLIFRELFKINLSFQKLKKKDFKFQDHELKANLNPIKNLNQELAGFATFKQREIDELKRMENYRQEFIADLSHELKTPIFATQGFIHTLLDGALEEPEVATRFLKKAAKNLDALDELVQDLLTLSEMETGSVKMKRQTIDLFEMVNDVFDQLGKRAAKRSVSLKLSAPSEDTIRIEGDEKHIFRVLTNLVENAIKYGNDGGEVTVFLKEENDSVEVMVEDDGPGISDKDQTRIFDRFYRVEKSRSKDKGGTGLGLAISRQIIEAHKSKIVVESKPGKGSRFSFKLYKKSRG